MAKCTCIFHAGKPFSDEEYVPIGNFYVMEDEKISPLSSDTTTANVQELVLKEPLVKTGIDNIKKGHMLVDYSAKLMNAFKQHGFPRKDHREVQQKFSLKPSSTGKASIVWTKNSSDESWTCRLLLLAGRRHLCLQPSASKFGGFPFDSSSEFEVLVSDFSEFAKSTKTHCSRTVTAKTQSLLLSRKPVHLKSRRNLMTLQPGP